MSTYAVLESIRDALAAVPGVRTSRIGMEASLTPGDYPIVRIVPRAIKDGVARGVVESIECFIYFGVPVHEFSDPELGLEGVYEKMLPFREKLLAAARAATAVASVVHDETILDEDRIDAYKLMALKVKIVG